jgi:preprotein translocase subunit YajC
VGFGRGKDSMNSRLRLLILLVVVAIILYFVIAQPDNAAATVRTILAAIGDAINQIIRFFRGLTA